MAIETVTATLDGTPMVEQGPDGWRARVPYLVTGLTGLSLWLKAPAALLKVPPFGKAYPQDILPINVINRSCDMIDGDRAKIIVTYGARNYETFPPVEGAPGESALIDVGSITEEVLTNKEIDPENPDGPRKQIILEHEYVIEDPGQGTTTIHTARVPVEVNVPSARGYARLTLLETASPASRSILCTGTVNKTPWNGTENSIRKWYCQDISGQSRDGGLTYINHYSFLWNPKTWDRELVFHDQETDAIPEGLVEGKGYRSSRVIDEVNWGTPETLEHLDGVLTV